MSEFPNIQISTFINGDQYVVRAGSGEELAVILKGLEENLKESLDSLNNLKQGVVATSIFTGDSKKKGDTAPPPFDDATPQAPASVPTCKHGPMDDLRHKDYKYSYYCTLKTDNWKDKCRPVP